MSHNFLPVKEGKISDCTEYSSKRRDNFKRKWKAVKL